LTYFTSGRVRGAVNLLLPHNPGYLPIAGYCLTPISAAKSRVEASTLSVACIVELGTPWGSLGRTGEASGDSLIFQVRSWLDYNPAIREKLRPTTVGVHHVEAAERVSRSRGMSLTHPYKPKTAVRSRV
jgi:hypothetical protein